MINFEKPLDISFDTSIVLNFGLFTRFYNGFNSYFDHLKPFDIMIGTLAIIITFYLLSKFSNLYLEYSRNLKRNLYLSIF